MGKEMGRDETVRMFRIMDAMDSEAFKESLLAALKDNLENYSEKEKAITLIKFFVGLGATIKDSLKGIEEVAAFLKTLTIVERAIPREHYHALCIAIYNLLCELDGTPTVDEDNLEMCFEFPKEPVQKDKKVEIEKTSNNLTELLEILDKLKKLEEEDKDVN